MTRSPMRALALVRLTGIVLAFSWAPLFAETGWRAGTGRVDITPSGPAWLSGYASRDSRSTGILGPIEVKALALEDARGRRLVAITCDLLTMPRTLAEPVARELASRWALPRSRILLTASHSHSAPVIRDALIGMYPLSSADFREIDEYTERVRNALVGAADQALASLRPARVAVGTGRATFAKNRRNVTPNDPVDHDVPILRVIFDGRAGDASSESESEVAPNASFPKEAVLFAYACHNTTLNGPDICGDWAGFAQADLEERNEGLLALFAAGCGGDQNPLPRRTIELARKYGREMAEAVEATIRGPMRELAPETRATIGSIDLPLVDAPSRETLEEDAKSADRYVAGRARRLLETLDARGKIDETYPYVAQVWRLGRDHFIAALAGEVVVEYALRLKREIPEAFGGRATTAIIAYANDCPAYIPSEKVLREGGYEGAGAMIYYGLHGPWRAGVEDRIVAHVLSLTRELEMPSPVLETLEPIEVYSGAAFAEGPVWGPDGALWFSDIPNDRILRLLDGNVFEARRPSGKANGLLFDAKGRLFACEGADGGHRRVTRTDAKGNVEVIAAKVGGKTLNSPNDVTIDAEGRIYFSDPRYSGDEPRELEVEGVYRILPDRAEPELVIADCERPNGLAVSPDGKLLYVSDTGASKLYAYRITDSAPFPRDRIVFDFAEGRGIDGMEVARDGTIWAAAGRDARSGLWVISPEGTLLEHVRLPEIATNCAFGGEDGKHVFVTLERSVWRVRARVSGFVPGIEWASDRAR